MQESNFRTRLGYLKGELACGAGFIVGGLIVGGYGWAGAGVIILIMALIVAF